MAESVVPANKAELGVQASTTLPPGTQAMMQTMAAVELYRAQREVANYFELAYLQLRDFPDVAKEVRKTATDARIQHLMTTGLMKKFTITADHIVGTMIPMILDAVNIQEPDIVKEIFAEILGLAESMKTEAENTQASYHKLQCKVQTNMSSLNEMNIKIMNKDEKREIEIEREKDLLKAAKLKEKQLEDEKQKMDEELENLRAEKTLRQNETNEKEDDEKTFLDDAIAPGIALGGGIGTAFEVMKTGVNIFQSIFGRKTKQSKVAQEDLKKIQDRVEKMFDKNQEIIERIHSERVDALNRLAKIKALVSADVGIGNAESLREASAHLGDVDKQFTRIIQFWSSMAAILKYLKDDTKAGEVYLKKIENPKHAERFQMSVARSKQGWTNFGRICGDYITESDAEIHTLYAFLSAPIGKMRAADRKGRLEKLMQNIEDDINNTYPQE